MWTLFFDRPSCEMTHTAMESDIEHRRNERHD
jgi:hypothetical protein